MAWFDGWIVALSLPIRGQARLPVLRGNLAVLRGQIGVNADWDCERSFC